MYGNLGSDTEYEQTEGSGPSRYAAIYAFRSETINPSPVISDSVEVSDEHKGQSGQIRCCAVFFANRRMLRSQDTGDFGRPRKVALDRTLVDPAVFPRHVVRCTLFAVRSEIAHCHGDNE